MLGDARRGGGAPNPTKLTLRGLELVRDRQWFHVQYDTLGLFHSGQLTSRSERGRRRRR